MTKGFVRLRGTIDVPLDKLDAAAHHLEIHIALTLAEPGCKSFDVTADDKVPGRFNVAETFVDQAAFDAHQKRAKASDWGAYTADFKRNYTVTTDPE